MGLCRSFLLQCGLVFDQQPRTYPTEKSRIAFVIGLLRGDALKWASAIWERQSPYTQTYSDFTSEMRKVFDHPVRGRDASKRLYSLHQGVRSVAEYAVEFRTLAEESGWNGEALQAGFYNGLSEQLKDELLSYPETMGLDDTISLAMRVDNRIRERRRERKRGGRPLQPLSRHPEEERRNGPPAVPGMEREATPAEPEPMQLGRYHIDKEEQQRRRDSNSCLYCGRSGHYLASCPQRPSNRRAR
uniref:CCHC-type domain-containing protein n=1 Tax=Esox lucius TaxID=8010 RepID=A0AAY5KUW2_ESOLU